MFSQTECLERREVTILHKIVLGIASDDLETALLASAADINTTDSNGRTALSLAAERGDVDAVTLLLQFGANARIPSSSGASPIHFAACARDPACLELLLAYSDIDATTGWSQTPLVYVAAYTRDRRHAQLLLDAGCDPEIVDLDGLRAIDWTAVAGNEPVASCLLQHGVDVDHVDNQGMTVVAHCVVGNRHSLLRMLLFPPDSGAASQTMSRSNRFKLLRCLAEQADLETMAIVRSLNLDFSDLDLSPLGEKSGLFQLLLARSDGSAALFHTFSALLSGQPLRRASVGDGRSASAILPSDEVDEDDGSWHDALEDVA